MSDTTFAGMEIEWDSGHVLVTTPGKSLTVDVGPVGDHGTVYGTGTIFGSAGVDADIVRSFSSELNVTAIGDVVVWYGWPVTGDTAGSFWLKSSLPQGIVAQVSADGLWRLYDGHSPRISFAPANDGRDSIVEVGVENYSRGVVYIGSDSGLLAGRSREIDLDRSLSRG